MVLCSDNADNMSASKHLCDAGLLVPVGKNFARGLIGGSRSACHLTVAVCGRAAPLTAQ